MTNPVRAPKKPKNQPQPFQESLAPGMSIDAPAAFTNARATAPRLSDSQLRIALAAIWILVMVLVGTALGLRLLAGQSNAALPGAPVANATVNVASLPTALSVAQSAPVSYPSLNFVAASSVSQAQSGNPFNVISGPAYQPADGVNALLPGHQTQIHLQGTVGTSPSL